MATSAYTASFDLFVLANVIRKLEQIDDTKVSSDNTMGDAQQCTFAKS